MKRAVVMAERPPDRCRRSGTRGRRRCTLPDLDLRAARLRAEREVIQVALARSNNTLPVAARLLGVSRPTLYGLMEAHGLIDRGRRSATDATAVTDDTTL